VLVTVPRVRRSCEHFPDGIDLHLLRANAQNHKSPFIGAEPFSKRLSVAMNGLLDSGDVPRSPGASHLIFFVFFTLVTGPRRSLSLKLSDTRVYGPQIRARLGTTAHFCGVVVLELRAVPV